VLLIAEAAGAAPHVVVHVTGPRASEDRERIRSAIRAQVSDVANLEPSAAPDVVIEVEVAEDAMIVRAADGNGRPLGTPRTVARGEVGATEAASIARAVLVAGPVAHDAGARTEDASAPALGAADGTNNTLDAQASPESAPPTAAVVPPAAAILPRADAAPAEPRVPSRFRVAALYTGASYAPQLGWESGLRIEAAWARGPFYVGAGYAYHFPATVSDPAATISVTRHAVVLFAGVDGPAAGGTVVLGADVGLAVDDTVRATRATSPDFHATDGSSRVDVGAAIRGHVRLRVPLVSQLALDVAPAVEVFPSRPGFVVGDTVERTVLAPSVLRFRLDVGGIFDAF
jgi:hypothetical protein